MNTQTKSHSLKTSRLTDICDVDRAKKGTIYPAGTIYVQVSAYHSYTDAIWELLAEPSELAGKYAVVVPKVDIIPAYLVHALEAQTAEWRTRFIGDAINISMDLFKCLFVAWHEDIEEQKQVLESFAVVDNMLKLVEKQIALEKEAKKYFMAKMFPENGEAVPQYRFKRLCFGGDTDGDGT